MFCHVWLVLVMEHFTHEASQPSEYKLPDALDKSWLLQESLVCLVLGPTLPGSLCLQTHVPIIRNVPSPHPHLAIAVWKVSMRYYVRYYITIVHSSYPTSRLDMTSAVINQCGCSHLQEILGDLAYYTLSYQV